MFNRSIINQLLLAVCLSLVFVGCTSTGNLGVMSRPSASPGDILSGNTPYRELGPVQGRACRFFLLAVIPFGDSTATTAMERALDLSGGDAILNASVATSLYGFVPIYNIFSFTCTTVKGVAVEFED